MNAAILLQYQQNPVVKELNFNSLPLHQKVVSTEFYMSLGQWRLDELTVEIHTLTSPVCTVPTFASPYIHVLKTVILVQCISNNL